MICSGELNLLLLQGDIYSCLKLAAIYMTREYDRERKGYYDTLVPRKTWHNKWLLVLRQAVKECKERTKENEEFMQMQAEIERYR